MITALYGMIVLNKNGGNNMQILNLKSSKKDGVFKQIGVEVSQKVNTYLTITALAKGVTKTVIVRGLIDDWIGQQTDVGLIRTLVDKLKMRWRAERILNRETTFEAFKQEAEKWLLLKGIDQDYVNMIIKDLKDETDNTNNTSE